MVEIEVVRDLDTSRVVGEAKGGIAFVTNPYTVNGNPINGDIGGNSKGRLIEKRIDEHIVVVVVFERDIHLAEHTRVEQTSRCVISLLRIVRDQVLAGNRLGAKNIEGDENNTMKNVG